MKKLLLALFLLFPACVYAQVQAGLIEAWTRGLTLPVWDGIVAKTAFTPAAGGAAFFTSLNPAIKPDKIATTPDKWVYHVVNYSEVFSKKEREALLKFEPLDVKIGKIAVMHDRSAAIYNQLKTDPQDAQLFSEKAFAEHQQKLAQLAVTLEYNLNARNAGYVSSKEQAHHEDFISLLSRMPSGFSREDIALLLRSEGNQPLFPVFNRGEINDFAAITTLSGQRQWVASQIQAVQSSRQTILSRDLAQQNDQTYRLYYLQTQRLQYLTELQAFLEKTARPRKSLIYRRRVKLQDDLPAMTDAQRLGYLQYRVDTATDLAEKVELETRLAEQKELYQPYATAEAFGVPYEQVLYQGYMNPALLSEQEQALLANEKTAETAVANATDKLDTQRAAMHDFEPEDLDFFTQYYRLTAQRDILKAELARRNFFKRFH